MDTNPLRILVVDDHPDQASSLAFLLKAAGHEVHVAYHAKEALAIACTRPFDAALLDIALPELDGYRLGVQIRQQPTCRNIVLIAMTGYADESHRARGTEAGFSELFVKPVEMEKLLAVLKKLPKRPL